eukprot:856892-Alexandrium_andersonii.AAC.1
MPLFPTRAANLRCPVSLPTCRMEPPPVRRLRHGPRALRRLCWPLRIQPSRLGGMRRPRMRVPPQMRGPRGMGGQLRRP